MATKGSRVRIPTRELRLEHTLDVDGQPVFVVIRRLPMAKLAAIFKVAPAFVDAVGKGEDEQLESSPDAMLHRIDRTAQFYETAERVVIESCIQPLFYRATEPPVGVDLTADDCEWADVDAIAETDKAEIMRAALELAGYFPTAGEAKETASFPDDGERRTAG